MKHLMVRSSQTRRHNFRRVLAVGYYGWGNFGDELFRAVAKRESERLWGPGTRVRNFVLPTQRLRTGQGWLSAGARALEALVGGLWAQKIVLFGGSVLSDLSGVARLRFKAFNSSRVFEAIGVSIGPFQSRQAEERVQHFLGSAARIIVRDSKSGQRTSLPVQVSGDLAALYPISRFAEEQRYGLTICPSVDSGVDPRHMADSIAVLLRARDQQVVTLLALNSRPRYGDVEYCAAISSRLAEFGFEHAVAKFENVDQVVRILSSSEAVWSQRLHGLIVAYLSDVPVLALAHHDKLSDFAKDIGLADEFVLRHARLKREHEQIAKQTLDGVRGWKLDPAEYISRAQLTYFNQNIR